jgi:hypothetical protein
VSCDRLVVVAEQRDRAGHNPLGDRRHDACRIAAVPDEIPEKGEALRAARSGVREARLKRLHVGVNVRQEGKHHADESIATAGIRRLFAIGHGTFDARQLPAELRHSKRNPERKMK